MVRLGSIAVQNSAPKRQHVGSSRSRHFCSENSRVWLLVMTCAGLEGGVQWALFTCKSITQPGEQITTKVCFFPVLVNQKLSSESLGLWYTGTFPKQHWPVTQISHNSALKKGGQHVFGVDQRGFTHHIGTAVGWRWLERWQAVSFLAQPSRGDSSHQLLISFRLFHVCFCFVAQLGDLSFSNRYVLF